jgi:5-methylcytosine-specific restriction endonuclease McrA
MSLRIYSQYDKAYQRRPKEVKKRVARNAARRLMIRKHGKAALAGKDVDHKRSLKRGGSNNYSNLRIRSRRGNRADKR